MHTNAVAFAVIFSTASRWWWWRSGNGWCYLTSLRFVLIWNFNKRATTKDRQIILPNRIRTLKMIHQKWYFRQFDAGNNNTRTHPKKCWLKKGFNLLMWLLLLVFRLSSLEVSAIAVTNGKTSTWFAHVRKHTKLLFFGRGGGQLSKITHHFWRKTIF